MASLNPLFELSRTSALMDRLMESHLANTGTSSAVSVPMDVWEEDGNILIKAAVPGVKAEDLEITLQDGMLTISGEMQNVDENTSAQNRRVYIREFRYGRFARSVRLPEDIDEQAIDAQFSNGFVTVRVPRKEPQQVPPRKLQVRNMDQNPTSGQPTTQVQDTHRIPAENQTEQHREPSERGQATGQEHAADPQS